MSRSIFISTFVAGLIFITTACSKNTTTGNGGGTDTTAIVQGAKISYWLTKSDQTSLLQQQPANLVFKNVTNGASTIEVDTTTNFQSIDGFGYTLTSGSATLINQLNPAIKASLLRELFTRENNGIGIEYLRISIGASDLSASVYTYNDLPAGQTDPNLTNFRLAPDQVDLIPLLKEILQINPQIKILATPWTAPVWMKDNGSSIGGSLLLQNYTTYANYFVKYIQQMKAQGITIDAITPQNEPLNPNNNPSMLMVMQDQLSFVKNYLGPAFLTSGITTKIIVYDHNADRADYPLNILADPAARAFVNGSAFHLYAGNISALTAVRNAYPDKAIYFTEQWTQSTGSFGGDLNWHLKNVIIGSIRNWSRNALEWNLANDPAYQPHTPGGCTECKGALTISSTVQRNVAYYIIAHASKFVPAGSVRIGSNIVGSLQNVAFKTPSGQKVLIVENDGTTEASFNIKFNNMYASTSLPAGAVATYVW